MFIFTAIPFLGLLMIAYAVVAIGVGTSALGSADMTMVDYLAQPVFSVTGLPSTTEATPWIISIGDIFIIIGILFLAIEIVRATSTNKTSMANHALSFMVFLIALLVMIFVKGFGTSTFFILLMMTMVDVLAGMFVSIITARRDFGVAPGLGG